MSSSWTSNALPAVDDLIDIETPPIGITTRLSLIQLEKGEPVD